MSERRGKVDRTSAGLRDALFDAMEQLQNGEIEANEAKAMASLAREICNTVQLELNVQRARNGIPERRKGSCTGAVTPRSIAQCKGVAMCLAAAVTALAPVR